MRFVLRQIPLNAAGTEARGDTDRRPPAAKAAGGAVRETLKGREALGTECKERPQDDSRRREGGGSWHCCESNLERKSGVSERGRQGSEDVHTSGWAPRPRGLRHKMGRVLVSANLFLGLLLGDSDVVITTQCFEGRGQGNSKCMEGHVLVRNQVDQQRRHNSPEEDLEAQS